MIPNAAVTRILPINGKTEIILKTKEEEKKIILQHFVNKIVAKSSFVNQLKEILKKATGTNHTPEDLDEEQKPLQNTLSRCDKITSLQWLEIKEMMDVINVVTRSYGSRLCHVASNIRDETHGLDVEIHTGDEIQKGQILIKNTNLDNFQKKNDYPLWDGSFQEGSLKINKALPSNLPENLIEKCIDEKMKREAEAIDFDKLEKEIHEIACGGSDKCIGLKSENGEIIIQPGFKIRLNKLGNKKAGEILRQINIARDVVKNNHELEKSKEEVANYIKN